MSLLTVRAAAERMGVAYSTLKQWIHQGKVRTTQTAGGHHRLSEAEIDRLLTRNADGAARERLTLIRLFEELRSLGYEGGYDAVRRYAKTWSREHASQTASAYVP